jgi:hypothetical protein
LQLLYPSELISTSATLVIHPSAVNVFCLLQLIHRRAPPRPCHPPPRPLWSNPIPPRLRVVLRPFHEGASPPMSCSDLPHRDAPACVTTPLPPHGPLALIAASARRTSPRAVLLRAAKPSHRRCRRHCGLAHNVDAAAIMDATSPFFLLPPPPPPPTRCRLHVPGRAVRRARRTRRAGSTDSRRRVADPFRRLFDCVFDGRARRKRPSTGRRVQKTSYTQSYERYKPFGRQVSCRGKLIHHLDHTL